MSAFEVYTKFEFRLCSDCAQTVLGLILNCLNGNIIHSLIRQLRQSSDSECPSGVHSD